jgi:hypothetical protein
LLGCRAVGWLLVRCGRARGVCGMGRVFRSADVAVVISAVDRLSLIC